MKHKKLPEALKKILESYRVIIEPFDNSDSDEKLEFKISIDSNIDDGKVK